MSDELIKRLRRQANAQRGLFAIADAALTDKSADALEAAATEAERLREALEPFAAIADEYAAQEDDDFQVWRDFDALGASLPLRHFRAARQALGDRS